MAVIERTYTIPLRKEWLKSPRYKRAKKAVTAVKQFLQRHMKAELGDIKLGKHLNEELWKHGIKNPPCRIRINVQKDEKGVVRAELIGKPIVIEKKEEVKAGLAGKIKEKITGKEEEKEKVVKEEVKIGEDKEKAEKKEVKPGEQEEKKTEPAEKKEVKPKEAEKPKEEKSAEKKEPASPKKEEKKAEEKPAEKKEEKPKEPEKKAEMPVKKEEASKEAKK